MDESVTKVQKFTDCAKLFNDCEDAERYNDVDDAEEVEGEAKRNELKQKQSEIVEGNNTNESVNKENVDENQKILPEEITK